MRSVGTLSGESMRKAHIASTTSCALKDQAAEGRMRCDAGRGAGREE